MEESLISNRERLRHTDSRSADKELQTSCLGNIIYACVSACLQLDELIERVLFLCNAPCSTVVEILLFNDRTTDVAEPDGMG